MAEIKDETKLERVGREPQQKSVEELLKVQIDQDDPEKYFLLGNQLSDLEKRQLTDFLLQNRSVFAWSLEEMPGVSSDVICHKLNVDPTYKPVVQKSRRSGPQQTEAVAEEVEKLLEVGAIREVHYPKWLANTMVVKKKNGKWRVCVDFTDLNKACPKNSFPLPKIDQLIDSTSRHEKMSFLDAY